MKTIYVKPKDADRKWFVIDAAGKPLGRVAVKAASIARGKHKPYYVPFHEIGDYVIIVNADKAMLTGNKKQNKLYYRHSGYLGGLKVDNYETLVARKPTVPMEKAVRGMFPRGPLGNKLYSNVKIYAGEAHPHEAQQPEALEL
ncbi:MAG: 50S ribosomal protein L13 [Spirochaetaceae bacterium]|nr:50S ribosomal protein L13 [Spirochaetaceae bacterium]MDT8297093.1 50S ribosomal protein L13 [Spirochaetaceae bacterium]